MTFPSSPFPRTTFDGSPCSVYRADKAYKSIGYATCGRCGSDDCVLPYYAWEARSGGYYHQDCIPHDPPRDFPILRSTPLWEPTWVERSKTWDTSSSRWWPPLFCDGAIRRRHGRGYLRAIYRAGYLERLFSSPICRCPDCLSSAQTIDIMLNGIAWALKQWPDEWEHRCWFGYRTLPTTEWFDCTCGAVCTLTNLLAWRVAVDDVLYRWGKRNQYINGDLRNTGRIIDLIRSTLIEPIVAEWSSYEP